MQTKQWNPRKFERQRFKMRGFFIVESWTKMTFTVKWDFEKFNSGEKRMEAMLKIILAYDYKLRMQNATETLIQ